MTTTVINNVPRELKPVLAMILNAIDRDAADGKQARAEMAAELRALLSAPSPAGVDGLEVIGYLTPHALESDMQQPGDEPLCRLSDAQAIIGGLRGEADQQAQRIGELEGLLREWRRMFDGGLESGQLGVLRGHTDAALSAGREPKQCT